MTSGHCKQRGAVMKATVHGDGVLFETELNLGQKIWRGHEGRARAGRPVPTVSCRLKENDKDSNRFARLNRDGRRSCNAQSDLEAELLYSWGTARAEGA